MDNLIGEDADDDSLGDNWLGDDLLGNNNPVYIDSNINIDIKTKSNLDEDMTDSNLLEELFGINIKNLFQQVRDQTVCKKLTREVLE